ncbi:MAG: DUF805 domain-containing protein [Pontixanthobacter sp.]
MLEYMFMPYRRYFDFNGRSSRSEYWYFMLLFIIVTIVGYSLMFAGGAFQPDFDPDKGENAWLFFAVSLPMALFVLVSIIPAVAVEIRRWHDQGKSGWHFFVRFVPLVGGLIVLFFMCKSGTSGSNKYGTDPLDRHNSDVFS